MTTNPKTLADLKPGDEVIIYGRYNAKSIDVVERLTKHHIILRGSTTKYRIRSGFELGSGWGREFLAIPKEGEVEAIRKEATRRSLLYTMECEIRAKKDTLTIDQLRAILEILK